jgi:hypothetical protein
MTDYHLNTDGPHSDDYTRHVASAFAESVRVLNYATRTSDGVPHPATLNSVLGELRTGIQRMNQLLRQLDHHLVRFDCDEIADSVTGNPSLTLGTARVDLNDALTDATNLADYLDKAFNDTSGLYLRQDDEA